MKFLCIPCDTPMRLQSVGPPERGSLSVVYSCPECGYEIAMLTNAYETQIVQSLGVRIGPDRQTSGIPQTPAAEANRPTGDATESGELASGSRCPFTAMIPAMEGAREGTGHSISTGSATERAEIPAPGRADESMPVRWTAAAEARLANVPAFVRPMARAGIERFARENGSVEVNEQILDAAREFFGM
jgi:hypothetical protein